MLKNKLINNLNRKLHIKFYRSFWLYLSISIISFTLTALLVIFNLFAIKFNPGVKSANSALKMQLWLFVIVVFLTTASGFITAIMTSLTFKQKAQIKKAKIKAINTKIEKHQHNQDNYSHNNKDEILIDEVTKIIND